MIDVNDLECLAKKSPDECFLNGRGVLKLISGIRLLEGDNRRLNARLESIAAATRLAAIEECIAEVNRIKNIYDDLVKTLIDNNANHFAAVHYGHGAENIAIALRALKEKKP